MKALPKGSVDGSTTDLTACFIIMVKNMSDARRRMHRAFTLIEILVVVAIIAVLLAILLPSMSRAREQARRSVCLSNVGHLGKAVMAFAVEHKGYGQLYADWDLADEVDPNHGRYAYQRGWMNNNILLWEDRAILKPWPIAYAKELGIPSLKHSHQYFLDETLYLNGYPATDKPDYHLRKFGKYEPFACPSDRFSVRETDSPEHVYGVLSYAINEDVFGGRKDICYSQNGLKDQLRGNLNRIARPASVAMFTDAGHESLESWQAEKTDGIVTIEAGGWVPTFFRSEGVAAFLDDVNARAIVALPAKRHGADGGVCVTYADGHAAFLKGTGRWKVATGWPIKEGVPYVEVPTGFAPQAPRVSPY
jgi:prepilin-type N-terminal cleavage/methylation domain-containing protein